MFQATGAHYHCLPSDFGWQYYFICAISYIFLLTANALVLFAAGYVFRFRLPRPATLAVFAIALNLIILLCCLHSNDLQLPGPVAGSLTFCNEQLRRRRE